MKKRRSLKKGLAIVLTVAMVAGLIPDVGIMQVSAATQEEEFRITENVTFSEEEMADNDELFAGYVQKAFLGDSGISLFSTENHMMSLNTDEKSIYEALKTAVAKIADGSESSTEISIADWTKTFTYEELGLTTSSTTEQIQAAVKTAFANNISTSKILSCLMADCPYEMYWYNKTAGTSYSYGISANGSQCTLSSLCFKMSVASAYASNTYTTNTTKTGATTNAVANARKIVTANEGKSDYEKLVAYRDKICELVSYNEEAANNMDTPYGDPWQLIYVFDNDSDTNVVCEGYSKAFQYLCELSTFTDDVICYTVSGYIPGGHMWNHVTIGGKNYLVDVTNCDAGAIGTPDKLFLKGMTGNISSGYAKTISSQTITYTFKDETKELFGTGEDSILNLSADDYVETVDAVQSVSASSSVSSLTWRYTTGATLSATPTLATGVAETPAYQWYTVSDDNTETLISGATNATYTMETGLSAGTYTYRVYASIGDCKKSADVSVTVEPLVLTKDQLEFTSDTITKKYDGTTSSTATVQIKAGVVADEAVRIEGTAEYNSPNVSEANTVTFTPKAITTGNYRLAVAETISNNATIEKKSRTDTPASPVAEEITATQITLKEVSGCEYAMVDTSNPGSIEIWQDSPKFSGLEPDMSYTFYQRFKGDANTEPSAWSESLIATLPLDLSNAEINVEESVEYNGQAQEPFIEVVLNGELVNLNMLTVSYENNKDAGTAKVKVQAVNSKYTGSTEKTFTIEKKELTPSISGTTSKIYDGSTTSDGTGLSINLDGIISGDDVTATATYAYDSETAGTGKTITASDITLSGAQSQNYKLSSTKLQAVSAGTIEKAPATIAVGTVAVNKKYLYSKDNEDSIDLSSYLPEDCGTVNYGEPQVDGVLYTGDKAPAISNNTLSYTVKEGTVGATGTIQVTVTTDNYTDYTITIKVELVEKIPVSLKAGSSVSLVNSMLTYGEALSTLTFSSAVFVGNGKAVAGTLAFKDATIKPSVGTTTAEWVFTPTSEEYTSVEGEVAITVKKATPKVEADPTVTACTYHPNKKLTNSGLTGGEVKSVSGNTLEGTWSWKDTDIVPTAGNSGYEAVFTPDDTANYKTISKTITVNVSKATPYIKEAPTAAEITYGDTLAAATLSSGSVQYSSTDETVVDGTFAWEVDKTKPVYADSGTTAYKVVFTPMNTNYNKVETDITVIVNKAPSAPDMPDNTMEVDYTREKVSDITTLPEGWEWQDADKDKALIVEMPVTATAVYTGKDAGNYEIETVMITITRQKCTHATTEVRGAQDATCTEKGYTGDTYCKVCGEKVKTGQAIDALGHDMTVTISAKVDATCTTEGKEAVMGCSRCEHTEGGAIIDALGHDFADTFTTDTEATCTTAGSKSKHCSRCDEKTEVTEIPKKEHTWDSGKVTKEATCVEKGVLTYTCDVCHETKTADIAINPNNHAGEREVVGAVEATCKEAGYTGDTKCKACGVTLITGTVIDKLTTHSYVNGVCSVCDAVFETTVNGITYKVVTETGENGKPAGKLVTVSRNDVLQVAVAVIGTGDDFTEKNPDGKVTVQSEITGSGSEQTFVVTKISDNAFNGASVTEIVVPATVAEVGTGAFGGATTITFNGSTVPSGIAGAISGTGVTVNVPEGTGDSFKAALGENVNIVEAHTHKYATTWTYDDTYHWHAAACGHVEEIADKAGHTFGEWTVTKEATEDAEGLKERSCSCGYKETEEIAQLPHTHKYADTWTYDNTYHWHAATCGHEQEVADKAEHTFGSWVTVTEATEDAEGVKKRSCSCGYKETAKIDKLAHTTHVKDNGTRVEPTCEEKGSITYKCTKCGEVMEVVELDALGHSYTSKVTKAATITSTGIGTYTCTRCGHKYTEVIPKLPIVAPAKGKKLTDTTSKAVFTVTKAAKVTTSAGTGKVTVTAGEVAYTKSTNTSATTLTIPSTVKIDGITYKVTSIGAKAFANNKKLTKVTIGSYVKTIGSKAFYKCTKLKTVKIGKNVTTIGASAFYGCTKLDTVSMGAKVATISDKAFYKCTALKAITIPATVKKIGKQAFYGCKKLKTVTIKTTKLSSSKVGSKAFTGIYAKATVKVPKSKYEAYKKLLKAKGLGAKASVKK